MGYFCLMPPLGLCVGGLVLPVLWDYSDLNFTRDFIRTPCLWAFKAKWLPSDLPFGADSEVSIATGATTFRYFLIVTTNNATNQRPPSTDSVAAITLELESASAAKYTKLSKSCLWHIHSDVPISWIRLGRSCNKPLGRVGFAQVIFIFPGLFSTLSLFLLIYGGLGVGFRVLN